MVAGAALAGAALAGAAAAGAAGGGVAGACASADALTRTPSATTTGENDCERFMKATLARLARAPKPSVVCLESMLRASLGNARRKLAAFLVAVGVASCGARPSTPVSAPEDALPSEPAAVAPIIVARGDAEQGVDHGTAKVPVTAADPQLGDALAPVTIVEFGDFECPFTARVAPTLRAIRELYGPSQVRIVWKHEPLDFHLHARAAHEAAAAVFTLGGNAAFWSFAERLLAHQDQLDAAHFAVWAAQAGVDPTRFAQALGSGAGRADVDDDLALAGQLGPRGTPAFRINGAVLTGAQPLEAFRAIIDEQIAAARELSEAGTPPEAIYPTLTNRAVAVEPEAATARAEPDVDETVWKIPVTAQDPARGPADALVTIVEWSDFECPFCKRVQDTLERVRSTYPDDVRLVWKDNPLPFHRHAKPSAVLGRVVFHAKGNDAFWQVHDALFLSQPALEDGDLGDIARAAGVAWPRVKRAITRSAELTEVEHSIELASAFEARGTPHFFVNGRRLAGAQPFEAFQEMIDSELGKARALVERGTPRARVYATILETAKDPPAPERKELPPLDPSAPSRGKRSAPVVIEEWADFQCPFCSRVEPTLEAIRREFGGQVRLVWHHLPLPFHQDAALAAEAAEEVRAQKGDGAFWRYHDLLLEAQKEPEGLAREQLEVLALKVGVSVERFREALDDHRHRDRVDADAEVGKTVGINGTPAFVINGYYLSGAQPESRFRALVKRALADRKRPHQGPPTGAP